ncbi:MAG: hypothetical protein HQK97_00570 [Nitrospirae bacterium]|nr:hypothetical protein [Nitrospirota bacterium]MBF0515597.1 hypothetical protein [Nitrospirota bacterium]
MKRFVTAICIVIFTAVCAYAGSPRSYQVTGPILEVKGDVITVQKGSEKWEIAVDKNTKVKGELKVGSKVTVFYQMNAVSVESKEEAKKANEKKK